MCIYIYICVYVCIYVYTYIYIYIYIKCSSVADGVHRRQPAVAPGPGDDLGFRV